MALGSLEYLVVGCEENHFMDQILPELRAAWKEGIIRIVDLFLFRKDKSGNIAALQLKDLSGEKAGHLALLTNDLLSLLTPGDIEQLARAMLNNRSVAILLFEHSWAVDLKKTIKQTSGIFVAEGLVISGVLQKLEEAFQASPSPGGQDQVNHDIPRQLKQLGALHDSKVITDVEYERTKKEILGD